MPTTRRRRTRDRMTRDGLSEAAYFYFAWGPYFEAEDYAKGKTDAELRAFWQQHRAAILARYLDELRGRGPGFAGDRPWPFWDWEPREPRRPTPPGAYSSQKVWDRQRRVFDWVEGDLEYLARLGLLEDWERDAYAASGHAH